MPTIYMRTMIKAPVNICFDAARNIDLHIESTKGTGETAIAGKTSGLIGLNETVTWRAKHLGLWQTLTVKITEMRSPEVFVDEMLHGAFRSMKHVHYFAENNGHTKMTDIFTFSSPLGVLGRLADIIFLKRYMRNLLIERNAVIKRYAELEVRTNKA